MEIRKKLEHINRMQKAGFKLYFSQRLEHFQDIYGHPYTDEAAHIAYRESMDLVKRCKRGESGGML